MKGSIRRTVLCVNKILTYISNVVQMTVCSVALGFAGEVRVFKNEAKRLIFFKYYPQMPLMAVTDFSGRRIKSGVIATPFFPICSIS